MLAAAISASLRARRGVAAEWASSPTTVTAKRRWPCTPLTTPIVRPAASRPGPARYAPRHSRRSRSPACRAAPGGAARRVRRRRRRRPASSFVASIAARSSTPANTAEPIAPGWKRLPSSSVQATSSMGRRVAMPALERLEDLEAGEHAVDAVDTAAGRLGVQCEPVQTGSAPASRPFRRRKRLPIGSISAVRPSCEAQEQGPSRPYPPASRPGGTRPRDPSRRSGPSPHAVAKGARRPS